jgi:hypothetical protein
LHQRNELDFQIALPDENPIKTIRSVIGWITPQRRCLVYGKAVVGVV